MSSEGKDFEESFQSSCKKTDFYYLRLVDSAKWVQGQGSQFTPSNKADSILHTQLYIWLLELKSCGGASVSFTPFVIDGNEIISAPYQKNKYIQDQPQRDIKTRQIKDLMEAVETENVIAGLIINYRERILKTKSTANSCYFVHVTDFVESAKRTGKSSISEEDCKEIGVCIPCEKKKVRYKYDIDTFVDRAITRYLKKGYLNKEALQKFVDWANVVLMVL